MYMYSHGSLAHSNDSVTSWYAIQGSFGRVYLGKWRETDVAVKVLIANGVWPGTCG